MSLHMNSIVIDVAYTELDPESMWCGTYNTEGSNTDWGFVTTH